MIFMPNALPKISKPENSPFVNYAKGSKERLELEKEIERIRNFKVSEAEHNISLWINGPVFSGTSLLRPCVVPHDRYRSLGDYSTVCEKDVHQAIDTVLKARDDWSQVHWFVRLHIFRTAARLLETKYLHRMVAAVMEDYSKNPFEAFIDVQELIDFLSFNTYYASEIYREQPDSNRDTSNMLDYLPLEGFIFAVSPNNFIAINGNLCTAPLIMGNVVVAKPSSDVVYSFNLFLQILLEAGLPKNVLSVIYGDSKVIGDIVLEHKMLSGIHFTGGTDTFNTMWRKVGLNIDHYRNYPELVGETGGKDAILVYNDVEPMQSAVSMAVGGFGAQGRKCSATSRVYMTKEMWGRVKPHLISVMDKIKTGDVADFTNYMGAIINEREFKKISAYIDGAKKFMLEKPDELVEVLSGKCIPPSHGWFIPPTVIVTTNPHYQTMSEEIFGPVITVCVLPQERFDIEAKKLYDETSPYALTGSVHTNNVLKFCEALHELRFAVGNIYDDRTTAAMVNYQPFSGLRKSGTDSKVGWSKNLRKWTRERTICLRTNKTTFPPSYLDRE